MLKASDPLCTFTGKTSYASTDPYWRSTDMKDRKEMLDALLAGKTLTDVQGEECYLEWDNSEFGPFVYAGFSRKERLTAGWKEPGRWSVKKGPKMRPMTRNEVLGWVAHHPEGWVVRFDDGNPYPLSFFTYDAYELKDYKRAQISPEGVIDKWENFEVPEEY